MLNYCTAVNPLRLIDIRSVLFGVPQGDSQWCGSTNVMLITAEGQLVELSVPQHLLLRSGRSHSRDLLLLRKLPHATTSGDTDLIATAFSTLQSSRIILKVHIEHHKCTNHLQLCNETVFIITYCVVMFGYTIALKYV